MGVVDPRDQDRHVGFVAKRRCRTDHRNAFGEARLPLERDLFRDRAEDEVDGCVNELIDSAAGQRENRRIRPAIGEPAAGPRRLAKRIAEGLAGGTIGSADRGDRKPRMTPESSQDLLPGDAGSAQDADAQWLAHTSAGALSSSAMARSNSAARGLVSRSRRA